MLPGAVAVGGGGQAGRGAVAVVLVAEEHLALGEGILRVRRLKVTFRVCLTVLRLRFELFKFVGGLFTSVTAPLSSRSPRMHPFKLPSLIISLLLFLLLHLYALKCFGNF